MRCPSLWSNASSKAQSKDQRTIWPPQAGNSPKQPVLSALDSMSRRLSSASAELMDAAMPQLLKDANNPGQTYSAKNNATAQQADSFARLAKRLHICHCSKQMQTMFDIQRFLVRGWGAFEATGRSVRILGHRTLQSGAREAIFG